MFDTTTRIPATQRAAHAFAVSDMLLQQIDLGKSVSRADLTIMMAKATGASDSTGAWNLRDAYDACEIAIARHISRNPLPELSRDTITRLDAITRLFPTHSYRTEDQVLLQQFSTPPAIGILVGAAVQAGPDDILVEPSAGTGLLAAFLAHSVEKMLLNELDEYRAALLALAFPAAHVQSIDGVRIQFPANPPTIAILNPPFSRSGGAIVDPFAAARHLLAAVKALRPGGRAVAIMPGWFGPSGKYATSYAAIAAIGAIRADVALNTGYYAKHGTTAAVRLMVIDKVPGKPVAPTIATMDQAIGLIQNLPPRESLRAVVPIQKPAIPVRTTSILTNARSAKPIAPTAPKRAASARPVELAYSPRATPLAAEDADGLYVPYRVSRMDFENAREHPTALVESAAMASVLPPAPTYRPLLTEAAANNLSNAQLETIVYAGQSFENDLPGTYIFNPKTDNIELHAEGTTRRRGFFLGDGTGAGKGRQVAGIIMDQWLRGNKRHIWVSKSAALVEDARRDWQDIGGAPLDIRPLNDWPLGSPIGMESGILFVTYATLRSERAEKGSRLDQVLQWIGTNDEKRNQFEGVIAFDEAHAMSNAAPQLTSRGMSTGSEQGLAGLRLQNRLPRARVLYVSATGAVEVTNLSYAARLGLWGFGTAFATRETFIETIRASGISAMEIVARDLKLQGLYTARALSFKGVEYDILEHPLTPEQISIYDTYAHAWQIIHQNLHKALAASGVTDEMTGATLNAAAKSAAMSRFESTKQRFFSQILLTLKLPSVIQAIEEAVSAGDCAVVQLVSTAESMLDRRMAEATPDQLAAGDIDLSPREHVFDYLQNAFPIQQMESFIDENGSARARPALNSDGNTLVSDEAIQIRDDLMEVLCSLPGVSTALDEIILHFGENNVAEITGRSKRIIENPDGTRQIKRRSAGSNVAETAAFMEDRKRILCFSDAGGTGRSYHADKRANNQRRRHHFLLEPGWKAAEAVQGLGRTHRTHQAVPPIFRPVTTDVRGEKRFISTIARRLDALGALTRGQRQTGGQNLFNEADNLESPIAATALHRWYKLLVGGKLTSTTLSAFSHLSGLTLVDPQGQILENLPPIQRWLNRLLAFPINLQNNIFDEYFSLIQAQIDALTASGKLDLGIESYPCSTATVEENILLRTDPITNAETRLLTLKTQRPKRYTPLETALSLTKASRRRQFCRNTQSHRVGIVYESHSVLTDEGAIEKRLRLMRPHKSTIFNEDDFLESNWKPCPKDEFNSAWIAETDHLATETESETIYLATGLLLPVWDKLPADTTRVLRVCATDGQSWLGRHILAKTLPLVCAKFQIAGPAQLSAADIIDAAMNGPEPIAVPGTKMQLVRRRVNDQNRFELLSFPITELGFLKSLGAFTEIISYKTRLFIPGVDVLDRIIKANETKAAA